MAPKDAAKIRKANKTPKPVEPSGEVIVINAGVIRGPSVASTFIEEELDDFIEKIGLHIRVKARIPKKNERPDDYPEGWVILYEYPFNIGYRFPLPSLMTELLETLEVSSGKIMPLAWRVVQVIDVLTKDMGMEYGLMDLLHVYKVKKMENTRYTLFLRSRQQSLVGNMGANDRGWKKRYVFVDKSSLGKENAFLYDG